MALFYFQIDGEAGTFDIDTEALTVSLPALERSYSAVDQFRDGAFIQGTGNFKPGIISFSRKYRKSGTGYAWNAARQTFLQFFTLPKYKTLYFYINNGSDTYRARVYPINTGEEGYTSLAISDEITFSFQMVDAFFENITATSQSLSITDTTLQTLVVNNSGAISVPPVITFTAGASFTVFQVEIAEGYGFRLESSWVSGDIIEYQCATGRVYVNGNETSGLQTAGSLFNLATGNNTIYIYATTGTFEIAYNERVL